MEQSKIDRISELSRKSRSVGLTDEEKNEQKLLREEYIGAFRSNLRSTLDTLVIVDEEGNRKPLKK
ncbi:MAG: DUF896 domain-containing protein [Oscillospiraceae bacterium]